MEWLKESWVYIALGAGFLTTALGWLRNSYAAERDRQALKNAQLEREKLELEVARLRNDPKVVADRRAIYERLRVVVNEITRDGAVSRKQINDLHGIWHDASFRFPADIVTAIKEFLHAAVGLHMSGTIMKDGPGRWTTEQWHKHVQDEHDASTAILAFEQKMVEIFQPYLSL